MGRSKYYPPELKKRIVDEVASSGKIAPVARRYGLSRNTIHRWMTEDQAGTLLSESNVLSPSQTQRLVERLNRVTQMLGESQLENQILRDLLRKTAQRSGTKPK